MFSVSVVMKVNGLNGPSERGEVSNVEVFLKSDRRNA